MINPFIATLAFFATAVMELNFPRQMLEGSSYRSKWLGGRGGGGETRKFPNQRPVVGIFGGAGAEVDGIGLIYLNRN